MGIETRIAEGAAPSAPTAPHATFPAQPQKSTGPQRFWDARRVRRALGVGLVLSGIVHWVLGPWSFLPEGPPIEFHDVEGELTIPIETIMEAPRDEPKPVPTAATTGTTTVPVVGPNALDASIDRHAPESDAGVTGETVDGASDASVDAEEVLDEAGIAMGVSDGGTPGGGAARDPASLIGAAGGVSAGPNNVTLLVNMAVIKAHPEGAKMGPILAAIPQWKQFMTGSPMDPLRDTDWILIMGPSLINTERDAVFVHYNADDAIVDHAIDTISKTYAKGGAMNVGVKGVKAWKGFADGAERAFLRPRPHLAVIVPATHATQFATVISANPINPHFRPGEALSLRALRPGGSISIIPQSITEARMWIIPRSSDGGADVYGEGDCPDEASAADAAAKLKAEIARRNSVGVRIVSGGLLNRIDVTSEGSTVKFHMPATKDQIDAILGLAAQQVGATLPVSSSDAPAPVPSAPK